MRGLLLGVVFFALLPFILIRGPFFGILMWFWVSLMNPQQVVWSSVFASVPYALIVGVLTLIMVVAAPSEPKLPPFNKTTILLLMLMGWIGVTTLFAIGPSDLVFDKWQLSEKMLLMSIVAYALVNSRTRVEQLLLVCVLSIGFWGFRGGLITIMTAGRARVYGPNNSMIGDNNDLGVALTMILPLIFYLRDRYRNLAVKWPVQVLIGLTILGDVFTYSRGALVAMSAMGSMLWLRSRHKVQILIVLIVAGGVLYAVAPGKWTDRMLTMEHYNQDASAETRLNQWQRCWQLALQRPIVGGGFEWSFDPVLVNRLLAETGVPPAPRALAAHSAWFEMLGDHGFVGLGLFVLILGSAFYDAQWLIRHTRNNPDLLWANNLGRMLQVALVGYATGASFVTQAMYDGLYALVIIAAAARRVVVAELETQKVDAHAGGNLAVAATQGGALRPQASG
jgi:putative inorganic carbon (hco3(-)) transporter